MAMSQKAKLFVTLLGTLGAAAGVAAYAYYGVFEAEKTQEAKKEADEKLFSFDREKVKKLVVVGKGETTSLEKVGDTWKIAAPIAADADKFAVDGVLGSFTQAKLKKVASETSDESKLKSFGLDLPAIRVRAEYEGGADELLLGADNDFDGSVFAKTLSAPRIVSLDGSIKSSLEKTTFDLREKRLSTFEEKDLKSLLVEGNGYAYTLARDEARVWQLRAPIQDRADESAANRIVSSLQNLRATKIAAETLADPKAFGLDVPKSKVTITLASDAKILLVLGESSADGASKVYARASDGFVAEVPNTILADLNQSLFDLRDKTILAFDKEEVTQIKLAATGSEEAMLVERKREKKEGDVSEETWSILSPKMGPAKKWKMSAVLFALSSLKSAELVEEDAKDLAKYGLDNPVRTATLIAEGGKELARLLVGKEDGDKIFVKSAASARVSKVEKSSLNELPKTVTDIEETPPAASEANDAPKPG